MTPCRSAPEVHHIPERKRVVHGPHSRSPGSPDPSVPPGAGRGFRPRQSLLSPPCLHLLHPCSAADEEKSADHRTPLRRTVSHVGMTIARSTNTHKPLPPEGPTGRTPHKHTRVARPSARRPVGRAGRVNLHVIPVHHSRTGAPGHSPLELLSINELEMRVPRYL